MNEIIKANAHQVIESIQDYQQLILLNPQARIIFLDTETTGISPQQGEKMVEIACLEMVNRELTGKHFHTYLNPEKEVSDGAFRVHGLSREFLSDKPVFKNIADELIEFIKESVVIIHNASFDLGFLDAELAKIKPPKQKFSDYCHNVIDSLKVARYEFVGKKNSLDALCDRFNVSREHRQFHGALLDTHLLANVWLAMTRGQDELFQQKKQNSQFVSELKPITYVQETSFTNYKIDSEVKTHIEYCQKILKLNNLN
jgi:DNA polymerase III subunit epsilon